MTCPEGSVPNRLAQADRPLVSKKRLSWGSRASQWSSRAAGWAEDPPPPQCAPNLSAGLCIMHWFLKHSVQPVVS